jgi:hypothetical protein
VCKNTVLNFYVPMQNHLLECLEARRRAQEHIKFNVREIQQCVVNVQKADFFGRHLGPMCRPSKLVEQNTPTHVRFISHEVQAGLFRVAQPQSVFDFPLNRTGHGMAQLPGACLIHGFVWFVNYDKGNGAGLAEGFQSVFAVRTYQNQNC